MSTGFRFLSAAAIALLLGTAGVAHADGVYSVRPMVQLGAGVSDGYQVGGATQASTNFGSDMQAHVDLANGTVRNYLQISGPDAGGSGFGNAYGGFSERLTFYGTPGEVEFSFHVDGSVQSPARDPQYNSLLQILVFVNLYVIDAQAGATLLNFTSDQFASNVLLKRTETIEFRNPTEPLDVLIDRMFSGSILVGAGSAVDVFATLSIAAALNANPVTVTLDFMNTGSFGIDTPDGVTFTSDSGVFLTGQQGGSPVPLPATLGLIGLGWAALSVTTRSRRRPDTLRRDTAPRSVPA